MRIPLYLKLMASYVLVFGLVFIPTFLFVRTGVRDEVRKVLHTVLEKGVGSVARQLAALDPGRFVPTVQALARSIPERITLIDLAGNVVADSYTPPSGAASFDNHLGRPEVGEAILRGAGFATRRSATTGQHLLYAARRFPESGPPAGIVRMSMSTEQADQSGAYLSSFFNTSGAVALSAAVLLSFLAAMVVSRPLRRIAAGARAFANGDFGFEVNVTSRDELGEVAQALAELAQKLRGRLVEAGADRTTLRALLDDMPVGIVLFDEVGRAVVVNGRARALCDLPPSHELEAAARLLTLPDQQPVIARVLATTVSEEASLVWVTSSGGTDRPPAQLVARWVSIAGPTGAPLPAVILREASTEDEAATLRSSLVGWSRRLHEAMTHLYLVSHAAAPASAVAAVADEMERRVPPAPVTEEALRVVPVGELLARALARARGTANARGLEILDELSTPGLGVIESGGRSERAVAWLLSDAVRRAEPGSRILVRDDLNPGTLRLWLRVPAPAWDVTGIAQLLSPLGGDAGLESDRDLTEAWVTLVRG